MGVTCRDANVRSSAEGMGLGWVDISNREGEERSYTGMDIEAGGTKKCCIPWLLSLGTMGILAFQCISVERDIYQYINDQPQ